MTFRISNSSRRSLLRSGVLLVGAAAISTRIASADDGWDAIRSAVNDAAGKTGAALLVLTPDDVVFREAFGPTMIEIPGILASASMGPSASAILALASRGTIGLDDPIRGYVRAFDGDKDKTEITIRHCLAHTSGIADPGNLLTPPDKDPGVTLEEEVDRAAKKGLVSKPGEAFNFGGMSYQAAGRAAEVASGMSWEFLFQQLLDDPVGSAFTFGETSDPRLAGGASTSVDSYGLVLQMILNDGQSNGVQVLSADLVREMRTNQIEKAAQATPVAGTVETTGYGLGWWLEELDAQGLAKRINAAGAYGTVPWIDFEQGYGAVLLMNDTEKTGSDLYAKIRPLIEKTLA